MCGEHQRHKWATIQQAAHPPAAQVIPFLACSCALTGLMQVNKVKSHPGWPRLMAVVASYLPSLAPRQLTNVFWAVGVKSALQGPCDCMTTQLFMQTNALVHL